MCLHYWHIPQSNLKQVKRISEEYFLKEGDISKMQKRLTTDLGVILPSVSCPTFLFPSLLIDLWANS